MAPTRLINTETLKVTGFRERDALQDRYAILSHRWREEEVTFNDLDADRDLSHKRGYHKLKRFCETARQLHYEWAWLDTCCIDKSSTTELAEAMRSMYRWYEDSSICLAYLDDVEHDHKALFESEWFDRGWTLQELIAPNEMSFYDSDWKHLGTKSDLLETLCSTSKVPISVLDHSAKLSTFSIAQRMSWAANRITERVEDRAYSLMGILETYVSMEYGEREQAFIRLQVAIISRSPDHTPFLRGHLTTKAIRMATPDGSRPPQSLLLAVTVLSRLGR